MPDADGLDGAMGPRRFGRVRTILIGVALVVLIGLIVLWSQRKPIATSYIDKALAERHVAARYRIAALGLGRQRLTDVVIGDPAHPDLVADWIELTTAIGVSGPSVTGLRAGHVRLRGRLVDGTLSLGAIDRLLPAPSGKPFALPAIDADIADARMRLETPQGVIGLKLAGQGQLDHGFKGQLAAVSDRLDFGGCIATRPVAVLKIRIDRARPTIDGPARIAGFSCAGAVVEKAGADLSIALNDRLDQWQGKAQLAAASLRHAKGSVTGLSGALSFTGTARDTAGTLDLRSTGFAAMGVRGAALSLAGRYRIADGIGFDGRVEAQRAGIAPAILARIEATGANGGATPIAPLIRKALGAAASAGRAFDLNGEVSAIVRGGRGEMTVTRLEAISVSGAHLALAGGSGVSVGWPGNRVRINGNATVGGGGLPEARISLSQAAVGAPVTGLATMQPYHAGSARLALTPLRFAATLQGVTHATTLISLSGPLGDGRVDGLTLPVSLFWDGRARTIVNPACAPLRFDRLATAGLILDRTSLMLCPVDGALLRLDGARLGGGARLAGAKLAGRLGATPLSIATGGAELRFADNGFAIAKAGVQLGGADHLTRLDAAHLDGRLSGATITGSFAGAGGQIANVPLLMSDAAGSWTLANGQLDVLGKLMVADAAADPRFKPLEARSVALRFAKGRITTTGTLFQPVKNVVVANVVIAHDLGPGTGQADLVVPGIAFSKDFQPDELTRLTFGVIANVAGTVSGEGHIRWNADGVASDGVFRTPGTDLAAAFGPVTGVAGEIRFTDLLNLATAPGQIATIKTINPGIAVNDGTVRYQLLPGTRVQVEEGRWPFAGGSLVLEPTLLDFTEHQKRQMTFRVSGMEAAQFLQQFDFKNLDATGVFDGTLPMIFDEQGGRIESGRLTVRAGGGTIAYVGEVSQKDLGTWGNLAFGALKSLRYRSLDIVMNGPLAGEMITEVRFAGVGQGAGAKRNFLLDRLQKLPLVFNVRIKAPFRQLIDSAQSFYDPKRLIERNLPALLEEQRKRGKPPATPPSPIQPPASRTMP